MPLLKQDTYRPSRFLRIGHINTYYAYFFRSINHPGYVRERIQTPDKDFFDIDCIYSGNNRLLILMHGLEGSSSSQYMLGMSKLASANGWDVIAMNYRGCSGEINLKKHMYHSGFTADLEQVISLNENKYAEIAIAGFSIGGNITMNYLGKDPAKVSTKVSKVVAISIPTNLLACANTIRNLQNRPYDRNFIKHLSQKIIEKNKQFPDVIDLSYLKKIKTIKDFDEYYTSRLNGFESAEDYYSQCQSMQFLPNVKVPTLIINAIDDPLLPEEYYPVEAAKQNPYLDLLITKFGGHVGYVEKNKEYLWAEEKILEFINQ